MTAKSCNQHEPLHQLYGYNECCLCKAEATIAKLQTELQELREKYEDACMDANQEIHDLREALEKIRGKNYPNGIPSAMIADKALRE